MNGPIPQSHIVERSLMWHYFGIHGSIDDCPRNGTGNPEIVSLCPMAYFE
jgi:hypothetical protein